jgi:hypothetical protein
LNELVVRSEERNVLWRSLRERALNSQLYSADLPEPDVPAEVLIALLGIKDAQAAYTPCVSSHGGHADW